MAFRNNNSPPNQPQGSGTDQGGTPATPQGLIGQAGVKPSGTVERSGTIPTMKELLEAVRSSERNDRG
jgi:hypothetical protein